MPEAHVPQIDDHEEGAAPITTAAAGLPQRKWLPKNVLEVALIGTGVFLGLMGERWREHAQHRELGQMSPPRFPTKVFSNRKALGAVSDYHATSRRELERSSGAGG